MWRVTYRSALFVLDISSSSGHRWDATVIGRGGTLHAGECDAEIGHVTKQGGTDDCRTNSGVACG